MKNTKFTTEELATLLLPFLDLCIENANDACLEEGGPEIPSYRDPKLWQEWADRAADDAIAAELNCVSDNAQEWRFSSRCTILAGMLRGEEWASA